MAFCCDSLAVGRTSINLWKKRTKEIESNSPAQLKTCWLVLSKHFKNSLWVSLADSQSHVWILANLNQWLEPKYIHSSLRPLKPINSVLYTAFTADSLRLRKLKRKKNLYQECVSCLTRTRQTADVCTSLNRTFLFIQCRNLNPREGHHDINGATAFPSIAVTANKQQSN